MNALKHGLTTPIEATPWAAAVADVEALLVAEGLADEVRHELARRIVEYERNVDYQRQRFLGEAIIPAPLSGLEGDPATLRVGQQLARQFAKLHEQIASRQRRVIARETTESLKSADRYHRRAANQLIKQLKSLGDR